MISIKDSLTLKEIRNRMRRGVPIDSKALEIAHGILDGDRDAIARFDSEALDVFRRKTVEGVRFDDVQVDALRELDSGLADRYEALRAGKSRARSTAERVADHVARRADIGDLPAVVDHETKESCRIDLVKFGVTYCDMLLKHAPSANMLPFIRSVQDAILNGGRVHVRWPRGKGKSTWIKIGILWATLYGHRRFAVCFAANGKNAKAIIGDIWKALARGERLLHDFPEVVYPVRCLNGVVQRCATQTYKGRPTEILKSTEMLTMPKIEGSAASGAMIICRGVKMGTRGLVDMEQRPDIIFFDDIQTKKTAGSKSATDWLEEFIQDDAMGMSGHDRSIAALMASTPIKANDLSERFADVETHPEWITFTTPLVIRWSSRVDLVEEFGKRYRKDLANRDQKLTLSRAFYEENQNVIEADVEMLDPLDGDRATEVSAFHHALILFYSGSKEGFESEYQMKTRSTHNVYSLEPTALCRSTLNYYGKCVVPDECRGVVGFVDVNADANAGLRFEVMAFGAGRVAATIAYGRYPAQGRLYPERATSTQIKVGVANGVVAVAQLIRALPVRRKNGVRVTPTALCFDLGWETQAVARAIKTLRLGFPVIGSHGFGSRKYQPYKPGGELRDGVVGTPGDHCHLSESPNGVFLAFHSDYWREEAQRAFLAPPLQPGSCSLWGEDITEHYEFLSEICNETLVDKGIGANGYEFWLWNKDGRNHYGDTHAGCFVVGSWYRLYDATEALVSRAVAQGAKTRAAAAGATARPAARTARIAGRVVRKPRYKLV